MAYNVNYNDARFTQVEEDRKEALTENEKMYGGIISDSDKYYQAQIDASKEWADKQTQLQQEKTDFAIEQIEQQKEQARKDYIKEQSGAYTDWQKQSNQYGSNAEKMAENGLAYTGYSESSQVSMFNTYQNRVASARETFGRAVLEYDNAMKEARLQNNSILAEIAFESLQKSLELSLQGFQYKNQLLTEKVNQKNIINNRFDTKWQSVLDQINTENALAEEIRQYNASLEEEKRQYNLSLAEEQRQFNIENAGGSGTITGGGGKFIRPSGVKGNSGSNVAGHVNYTGENYEVNTAYFKGSKNPDGKTYGTFKNGYQPKGIAGHGKVKNSGKTIQLQTKTLSGQPQTLVQTVWQTEDGRKWYWEGRENKYKPLD